MTTKYTYNALPLRKLTYFAILSGPSANALADVIADEIPT